ncbi:methyltransferase family protein [Haloactinopolyspora alba]|uniref:Methyltransferase family protein n=1 Tax=Haloactinopolyspora alba TaxID=648780 RepID=A0A2P8E077_9ACTN|nr:class I SAM-dependent methyltransferase [Haloactinopolyspora alba]PSL02864.1 methyltransferase family protein [Haloactinopolyspora alba]
MTSDDPKRTVRLGYDAISYQYRADDGGNDDRYQPWIAELRRRIPAGGEVLDLGCGCGVPVSRELSAAGYAVTGVDFSEVQVRRARELAPTATFLQSDVTDVEFPDASFDAVVCLYTVIHLPLAEQPPLLRRIAGWLRPGGLLLATTGHGAWTGTDDDWLGGGATMWWSHADAATYRSWITDVGLDVEHSDVVPEGDSAHALFWARRP